MSRFRIIAVYTCFSMLACVPQVRAQVDPSQIIIPWNGHPARLLGFIATGPKPDLDRLLAAVAATPFVGKELPSPEGLEVMVLFKPGSDPKTALEFFSRAQSTEFSTLKIGAVTYPVDP